MSIFNNLDNWLSKAFAPLFGANQVSTKEELMQAYCQAVLSSPALSAPALGKLNAMEGMDWSSLMSLFLTYGAPAVVKVLEDVIPTLPIGAGWQALLVAVISELAKLLPGA